MPDLGLIFGVVASLASGVGVMLWKAKRKGKQEGKAEAQAAANESTIKRVKRKQEIDDHVEAIPTKDIDDTLDDLGIVLHDDTH